MADFRTVSSSTRTDMTTSMPPNFNNAEDLTEYINSIFHQMEKSFMNTSDQIMTRLDELGQRIDTLENSITEITSNLRTEKLPTTKTNS